MMDNVYILAYMLCSPLVQYIVLVNFLFFSLQHVSFLSDLTSTDLGNALVSVSCQKEN